MGRGSINLLENIDEDNDLCNRRYENHSSMDLNPSLAEEITKLIQEVWEKRIDKIKRRLLEKFDLVEDKVRTPIYHVLAGAAGATIVIAMLAACSSIGGFGAYFCGYLSDSDVSQ